MAARKTLNFNPRSREGSDPADTVPRFPQDYFNPRSREGSDAITLTITLDLAISIHAPAKGATFSADIIPITAPYFNPRSREGSDKLNFQYPVYLKYFNPRSREGSDIIRNCIPVVLRRFQSTLPRRERRHTPGLMVDSLYFNPRSREGSDVFLSIHDP